MYSPADSPFPFTSRNGAIITDERCRCGALRSEHENTMAFGHGPRIGEHGAILCAKFTWVAFVYTTKSMPDGFQALDDQHAVKIERASVRSVGAKGWRYEVRDLSKPAGKAQRILSCTAPSARTKRQAFEHAQTELRIYLERRAGMTVLEGGAQ